MPATPAAALVAQSARWTKAMQPADLFLGMVARPALQRGADRRAPACGHCGAGIPDPVEPRRIEKRARKKSIRRSSRSRPRPASRHYRRRRSVLGALPGSTPSGNRPWRVHISIASASICGSSRRQAMRTSNPTRPSPQKRIRMSARPWMPSRSPTKSYSPRTNASILPDRKVAPALSSPNVPGALCRG